MSRPKLRTFEDWRKLYSAGPEVAAEALRQGIEAMPPGLRRAVFAWLPQTSEWQPLFAAALNPDAALHGIPCAVKDLFAVKGSRTLAGSRLLGKLGSVDENDSSMVRDLRRAGLVIAAKTQLNEFAYGLSGENPHYGDCPHPLFDDRLAGGSSSGSAYAVGAGVVPLAIGTDTAGSIRAPAAFCGIYGLRLADSKWTGDGCFPLAPSFDTAGWFCANAQDMASASKALLAPAKPACKKLRIIHGGHLNSRIDRGLASAMDVLLDQLGCQRDPAVEEYLSSEFAGADVAYNVLGSREAYQVHANWLDAWREYYDPVVWQRIDRGRRWMPQQIQEAELRHKRVCDAFARIFTHWDVLALPALPAPSPTKRESTEAFRDSLLRLLCPGSLARLPCISVPVCLPNRLSGGLQLLVPDRERCLAVIDLVKS